MALLAIFDQGAELCWENGALRVERGGKLLRILPTHEVQEVQLYGTADLSPSARNYLLKQGIDTVFLTLDGRYRGRLLAAESREGERRLCQYRFLCQPQKALAFAQALISGKILNQYDQLLRRQRRLRNEKVADVLVALRHFPDRVAQTADLEGLRGVEGQAALLYFSSFSELLEGSAFSWNGRNRRPPKDPVNACLSFGYTLLCTKIEGVVRRVGLDPYLGVLHGSSRGNLALVLDLAEEWRPLVDDLVLRLCLRQQLAPSDFGPPENGEEGAIYLGPTGRAILLREWALRLQERSPHPLDGAQWTVEGMMEQQAQAFRRLVEGEAEAWKSLRIWG